MADEPAHKHKVGDTVEVTHESPHIKKHHKHKVVSSHYGPYYGVAHPHGGVVYVPADHVNPAPPNAEPGPGATGTGPHASDNTADWLESLVQMIGRLKSK